MGGGEQVFQVIWVNLMQVFGDEDQTLDFDLLVYREPEKRVERWDLGALRKLRY